MTLDEAHRNVQAFKQGSLANRIARLESLLAGKEKTTMSALYSTHRISSTLLESALALKLAASQINEVVHAVGILLSLPYILNDGEKVQMLSLAAGNTGKPFDLETDSRVAEFKFIDWKGGPESIRQNQLFKDFYLLAEFPTSKKRYLYVVGDEYPIRFLNGGRALQSVMSRNMRLFSDFKQKYGTRYSTVREYYRHRQGDVILADLAKCVPHFGLAVAAGEEDDDI
jgi:hypothetical protein